MSAPSAGNHHPLVLRQTGAVVVPLAVWAFCLLAVGDAVVEGSPAYAVRTVLVTASVALAVWVVLYSPRLEVTRDGLRVVNPLRVHDVPYAALESVRVRGLTSLTFRAADGRPRTVSSWNAPGSAPDGGRDAADLRGHRALPGRLGAVGRTRPRAGPDGHDDLAVGRGGAAGGAVSCRFRYLVALVLAPGVHA